MGLLSLKMTQTSWKHDLYTYTRVLYSKSSVAISSFFYEKQNKINILMLWKSQYLA